MGNSGVIYTVATAFAAACFARALSLRTNAPLSQQLLWYAVGAAICNVACLFWVSVEPGLIMQQRIVLGLVGAAVGIPLSIAVGEAIRPKTAMAQVTTQTTPSGPATPQPSQSVTSYNQSGGITAGTINVSPQQRSLNAPAAAPLKAELLAKLPRDKPIAVMAILGNSESIAFAREIAFF